MRYAVGCFEEQKHVNNNYKTHHRPDLTHSTHKLSKAKPFLYSKLRFFSPIILSVTIATYSFIDKCRWFQTLSLQLKYSAW